MAINKFITKEMLGEFVNTARRATDGALSSSQIRDMAENIFSGMDNLTERQVQAVFKATNHENMIHAMIGAAQENTPEALQRVADIAEDAEKTFNRAGIVKTGKRKGMMKKTAQADFKQDLTQRANVREANARTTADKEARISAEQRQDQINRQMGIPNEIDEKISRQQKRREVREAYRNQDAIEQEARRRTEQADLQQQVANARQERYSRGQSSAPTETEHAARQAEYDELGKRLDAQEKADRGLRTRFLDGVQERATGFFNTVTGQNRRQTTAARREYNNFVASQGGNDFVTSNSQFKQMQKQYGASNADTPESLYENITKAQETSSGGIDWAGISKWAHDNQLIVAGGIAGAAIIGANLLDDDY